MKKINEFKINILHDAFSSLINVIYLHFALNRALQTVVPDTVLCMHQQMVFVNKDIIKFFLIIKSGSVVLEKILKDSAKTNIILCVTLCVNYVKKETS